MAFGKTKQRGITGKAPRGLLKRILTFCLPLLVLLFAVFLFLQMSNLKPKPETKTEAPRAAPVVTAQALQRDIQLSVQTQGEVRPRTEINIAAQVGGKISSISPNFLEGGQFSKGEILLRIESAEYDLRVTQAQANVAQARTVLTRELSEADIAQQDWEDLGEGTASALTLRKPQVAEARARLAANQAALEEAKLQQSRTVMRAPFDGRVREKLVDAGAFIGAGQQLGRIYAVDIMDVKLPLTDADLAKLGLGIGFKESNTQPGPTVIFSANIAGEPQEWTGRIARTDSGYDVSTRMLFAYAQLDDPYGKGASNGTPMASGLFVSAKIAGRSVSNSVIVPRNALRGTDTVFVANDDNTLSIRPVRVASSEREQVVIVGGLSSGETVITSPVRSVAEGMRIEIAQTPTGENEASLIDETGH